MRIAQSSLFSPEITKIAAASFAVIALLSGCGDKKDAPGPGARMPQPEVGVISAKVQPIALETELPARAEAIRVAQVRARVNGVVLKRLFEEGSEVKQGQSLFQIDPEPYQAQLNSAQAELGKAQANLAQQQAQAARYKPLVAANAVSKQEYVNVVATQK